MTPKVQRLLSHKVLQLMELYLMSNYFRVIYSCYMISDSIVSPGGKL